MTNYREILRLISQGISQRSIAVSCECSRNTVASVVKQSEEFNVGMAVEPRNDEWRVAQAFLPRIFITFNPKAPG